MIYGYARVSTKEQNLDRQIKQLTEAGVKDKNIFVDKQSGKDFNRPSYKLLIRRLQKGDLLYVISIDRLGRDYEEIQQQWRAITKEKCADICVLDMPLLDTRQGGDLMRTFISDLILQILSYVAQTERENIRKRQAQGIEVAKLHGVKFGRPTKPIQENFDFVYNRWKCGAITGTDAARELGMTRSTFRYQSQKYEKKLMGE